jgi:predicted 3-demethylubiquinone-9 3-methyltransferase (glyoxalase superfamily)
MVPHLWFDREAREAAEFYVSLFPNSRVTNVNTISGTPSGDCHVVSFEIWGWPLMAISAGPFFKFNPSISFLVNIDPSQDSDAEKRIDEVWAKLYEGGTVLMPMEDSQEVPASITGVEFMQDVLSVHGRPMASQPQRLCPHLFAPRSQALDLISPGPPPGLLSRLE